MTAHLSVAVLPLAGGESTVGYKVVDTGGNELIARTTAGITEIASITGLGIYAAEITLDDSVMEASVVWDDAATPANFVSRSVNEFDALFDDSFSSLATLPVVDGVGTVGYTLYAADGTELAARSTSGVSRIFTGDVASLYQVAIEPPAGITSGIIVWDDASSPTELVARVFSSALLASTTVGESTLSITRTDIKNYLARYLPITRTISQWSPTQAADIDQIIKSGERQFYEPPVLRGETIPHLWSFNNHVISEAITTSDTAIDLPADFGGFVTGTMKFAAADNNWLPVQLTTMDQILHMRQTDTLSFAFQALYAAINLKARDQTTGTRYQLEIWPSDAGTLAGTYRKNPNALTDAEPYPLGGQPHAETLIQSCLAAAEHLYTDARGIQWDRFMERLRTSVGIDRQLTTPAFFGYNGSGRSHRHRLNRHDCRNGVVTYIGSG